MKNKLPINRADDIHAYRILERLINNKDLTWTEIFYIRGLKERVKSVSLDVITADNFSMIADIVGKIALIESLYPIF